MHHWTKRLFTLAAPLLLTGCLWGPGKFTSDLTLRKDGSFVLDYRGEIVLQLPDGEYKPSPWKDTMAQCYRSGRVTWIPATGVPAITLPDDPPRPCTPSEIAKAKSQHQQHETQAVVEDRKKSEEAAKAFGLPGLDDASNRAFAAKLMKYAGWRSVAYRGNGVFDVDYHLEGRATQDFIFPALPDNDLLIPFIAIRRRADGSVLVNAPALTGGAGPMAARAGAGAMEGMKGGPVSRAQGRFTVITDGEILTNNSEDGPAPHAIGHQLHWDVGPASNKIPETLIRL
ncbi:MAG TPA: hypothetical protein VE968_04290 [Sphingomicrobium sp.]|nr:hypothetical protein [Sphingomicrobium sp.]